MTSQEFLNEWRGRESFIVCHTSGSTGTPKNIRLPKVEVGKSALRTNEFFGINSGSRLHLCISPDYIGGKMMLVRAEIAGCKITEETPSNRPLSGLDKSEDIDLLAVVASQLSFILDNLDSLPHIKHIICGGSTIPLSLRERVENSGLEVFETYGMTETASHIALRRVNKNPEPFVTLPGISVSLENECLAIHIEGWRKIVTNDLAEVFCQNVFNILGRRDNVIISGGKKFYPEEIENMLSAFIRQPFIVTGEDDEKWGERIVCKIETDGLSEPDLEKLATQLRMAIPHDKIPKKFIRVASLPRTPNGKILRK